MRLKRLKVTDLDWYADFEYNDFWSDGENCDSAHEYIRKADNIPQVLLDITNPNPKLKYWIRLGKELYRCYSYQRGMWFVFKKIENGFYDLHIPRISHEEYIELTKLSSKLQKKLSPEIKKDMRWHHDTRWFTQIRRETRSRLNLDSLSE